MMPPKPAYRVGDDVVMTYADGTTRTGPIVRITKAGELVLKLGPPVTKRRTRKERA